jgi:putative sigma-54 modulation protein
MPLQITARKLDLSDEMRQHIEERVDRFRKLAVNDKISVLDVVITEQKGQYQVEVVVKASRFGATGKITGKDLRGAIDTVMTKVEKQLRKQLDKKRSQKRHSREVRDRRDVTLTVSFDPGPDLEPEVGIIQTERIATKPMSVEEAAEQLEMEAGSFRVFTNAETERINIIYRRDDGHFGVIEPS